MKLKQSPFDSIKAGTKTVEMRVNDEKRKVLKKGDRIVFSLYSDETQKIEVVIKKIKKFESFAQLYATYDKVKLGYQPDEEAKPEDMSQYYSPEDMAQGVLAIEIKLVNENEDKKLD